MSSVCECSHVKGESQNCSKAISKVPKNLIACKKNNFSKIIVWFHVYELNEEKIMESMR